MSYSRQGTNRTFANHVNPQFCISSRLPHANLGDVGNSSTETHLGPQQLGNGNRPDHSSTRGHARCGGTAGYGKAGHQGDTYAHEKDEVGLEGERNLATAHADPAGAAKPATYAPGHGSTALQRREHGGYAATQWGKSTAESAAVDVILPTINVLLRTWSSMRRRNI